MMSGKAYVVISGLPGSGKSSLARRLAPLLDLPVIDKDDILERLFELRGVGDIDHRRALSRQSDSILREEAKSAGAAILVSFWRLPGMPPDSGTPTEWIEGLSDRVVNLHCVSPPAGHLDAEKSEEETLLGIQAVARIPLPVIGRRIDVDTSEEPDVDALAGQIQVAFRSR